MKVLPKFANSKAQELYNENTRSNDEFIRLRSEALELQERVVHMNEFCKLLSDEVMSSGQIVEYRTGELSVCCDRESECVQQGSKMKQNIARVLDEIKSLVTRRKHLESSVVSSKRTLYSFEDELQAQQRYLEHACSSNVELETEFVKLKSIYEENYDKLHSLKEELNKMVGIRHQLNQRLDTIRDQNKELSSEMSRMKEQQHSTSKVKYQLLYEHEQENVAIHELNCRIEEIGKNYAKLKSQCATKSMHLETLMDRLKDVQKEVTAHSVELDDADEVLNSLRGHMVSKEEEVSALRMAADLSHSELSGRRIQLRMSCQALEHTKASVCKSKSVLDSRKSLLAAETEKYTVMQTNRAFSEKECVNVDVLLSETSELINEHENEIKAAQLELLTLKTEITNCIVHEKEIQVEKIGLISMLARLLAEQSEKGNELCFWQTEALAVEYELSAVKGRVKELSGLGYDESEKVDLLAKLGYLESQVESVRRLNLSLRNELNHVVSSVKGITVEMDKQVLRRIKMEEKISMIEGSISTVVRNEEVEVKKLDEVLVARDSLAADVNAKRASLTMQIGILLDNQNQHLTICEEEVKNCAKLKAEQEQLRLLLKELVLKKHDLVLLSGELRQKNNHLQSRLNGCVRQNSSKFSRLVKDIEFEHSGAKQLEEWRDAVLLREREIDHLRDAHTELATSTLIKSGLDGPPKNNAVIMSLQRDALMWEHKLQELMSQAAQQQSRVDDSLRDFENLYQEISSLGQRSIVSCSLLTPKLTYAINGILRILQEYSPKASDCRGE